MTSISSSSPNASALAADAAADRASDAALAKAAAQLAGDKKSGAAPAVLSTDQQAVAQSTKAAAKIDVQTNKDGGKVNVVT